MLHSLDEDDGGSIGGGRITPRKRSSKSLHHPQDLNTFNTSTSGGKSQNTSPKTPSHYPNITTSPIQRVLHDVNGSIKSSPVDDVVHITSIRDEEVSLLPKNS